MKIIQEYNVTKKELEKFVLAGWRLSAEGYSAEVGCFITSGVRTRVGDVVDEVIAELTEETK